MKKWKYGIILAALSVAMMGCGNKQGASTKEPITITIWHYYSGSQLDAFNSLVDEFNKTKGKELGIIVESFSGGNDVDDLNESVIAAAKKEVGAKKLPNIFSAYADTAYIIDQMDIVEDISPFFSEEEKSEYVDSYIEEGAINGEDCLKIFPTAKATEIFMLNKTDWDKFAKATGAKLSELETIEGVTDVAKRYYDWTDGLTEEMDDGKAFFGRDAMPNYMMIGAKQLGTDIISVDDLGRGVLDFDKEVIRKLWDNYYVPYINGYFSSIGRFRNDDVKTGNVISFVGSSASATFFPTEVVLGDEERYPIENEVLQVPKFAEGKDYVVQQGAGMVVLKAEEEEVKASVEFLKWFTEGEQNIKFALSSGYLPVKKDANDVKKIEALGGEKASAVIDALEVSVDTIKNNNTYTTPSVRNGQTVRNMLGYSLSDKAVEDRALVEKLMSEGMSRKDAVAQYDTDENFEAWYDDVKMQLEKKINE